jgi:hypothetical protein
MPTDWDRYLEQSFQSVDWRLLIEIDTSNPFPSVDWAYCLRLIPRFFAIWASWLLPINCDLYHQHTNIKHNRQHSNASTQSSTPSASHQHLDTFHSSTHIVPSPLLTHSLIFSLPHAHFSSPSRTSLTTSLRCFKCLRNLNAVRVFQVGTCGGQLFDGWNCVWQLWVWVQNNDVDVVVCHWGAVLT